MSEQYFVTDKRQAYEEALAANDEYDQVGLINQAIDMRKEALLGGIHPNQVATNLYARTAHKLAREALEGGDFRWLNTNASPPTPWMPGSRHRYTASSAADSYIPREMFLVELIETRDELSSSDRQKMLDRKPVSEARRWERMNEAARQAGIDYKYNVKAAQEMLDTTVEELGWDRMWFGMPDDQEE